MKIFRLDREAETETGLIAIFIEAVWFDLFGGTSLL